MKILAVIENDTYIRNFLVSGAFKDLQSNKNFKITVSNKASKLISKVPKKRIIGTYTRNEHNKKLVFVYNNISMRSLKHKSSTFRIKSAAYNLSFKDYIVYNLFSMPIVNKWAKNNILGRFKENRSLEKIVGKFNPDIAIFPVTGVESTGNELILMSKKYKFKTLFLVNGWDNLSSKGIFLLTPDYIGVWGSQDHVDAVNIQNINSHRSLILGSSRYDNYFSDIKNLKSPFPFEYILFAGATTACDEITPLRILDQILNKISNNKVKIVYRPHPWRERRKSFDTFVKSEYKNIVIDPQVEGDYYRNKKKGLESGSSQNFPELEYYPKLLSNAKFIISPTSSFLLEAALLNVPAIVLAYDDGVNPIPPSSQAQYHHFEGTKEIPGWFYANNYEELKRVFKKLFEKFSKESKDSRMYRPILKDAVKKYVYFDENSYFQRLSKAVNVIYSQKTDGQ